MCILFPDRDICEGDTHLKKYNSHSLGNHYQGDVQEIESHLLIRINFNYNPTKFIKLFISKINFYVCKRQTEKVH